MILIIYKCTLFPLNSYHFAKPYLARVCARQNRVYKFCSLFMQALILLPSFFHMPDIENLYLLQVVLHYQLSLYSQNESTKKLHSICRYFSCLHINYMMGIWKTYLPLFYKNIINYGVDQIKWFELKDINMEILKLLPLNSYPFTKSYVVRVWEGQNWVYK